MKAELDIKLRAIVACVVWGSAFAGAKIAFEYMEPVLLSAIRFILAGLLLFPVIAIKKIALPTSAQHWRFITLFAFVQTFMQYGLFYAGLDRVPAAISSIIIGGGPLLIALMAHFSLKDDKMSLQKFSSIVLGIAGVVFISFASAPPSGDAGNEFYVGVALLLASNIVGSYTNIMVVKQKTPISPYTLTAFANLIGGFMLLAMAFVVEEPTLSGLPPKFYIAILWLAMIPAIGFSLWYELLGREGVKVSELNMWKFLVPVTGCVLAWLLLPSESPTWESVIGITIIVAALQLNQYKRKSKK